MQWPNIPRLRNFPVTLQLASIRVGIGILYDSLKTGTIKDRNGMDLTEAEDIKKRWQEYTEEQYKKDLQDLDKHDG